MMHTDLMRFEDIVLAAKYFAPGAVTLARAPGRLDVMGGIADYSGSLVAEMPIAAVCCVAAQRTHEPSIVVRTADAAENGLDHEVTFPLDVCVSVSSLQAYLRSLPKPQKWLAIWRALSSLPPRRAIPPRGRAGSFLYPRTSPLVPAYPVAQPSKSQPCGRFAELRGPTWNR